MACSYSIVVGFELENCKNSSEIISYTTEILHASISAKSSSSGKFLRRLVKIPTLVMKFLISKHMKKKLKGLAKITYFLRFNIKTNDI